jgi:hypothetical protein
MFSYNPQKRFTLSQLSEHPWYELMQQQIDDSHEDI